MKKILLSIAILASSITAFGQTPTASTTSSVNTTEQTICAKDKKSSKFNGKKRGMKDGFRRDSLQARQACLFEGLNLTAEQQTKLDALRAQCAKERQAAKAAKSKEKKSELTKEQRAQKKADRIASREASRKSYLAKVKEILTPEQYNTFLEKSYTTGRVDKTGGFKGARGRKGPRQNGDKRPCAPGKCPVAAAVK